MTDHPRAGHEQDHVHHPDHDRAARHVTRHGSSLAPWQSRILFDVGLALQRGESLADSKVSASKLAREAIEAETSVEGLDIETLEAFLARVGATAVLLR